MPVHIAMLMGLFGTDRSREHIYQRRGVHSNTVILSVSIKAALLATASIGQRLQDGHCFRRIPLFKIIEIKTKTEIYQIFVDNLLLTIALQHSTNCN